MNVHPKYEIQTGVTVLNHSIWVNIWVYICLLWMDSASSIRHGDLCLHKGTWYVIFKILTIVSENNFVHYNLRVFWWEIYMFLQPDLEFLNWDTWVNFFIEIFWCLLALSQYSVPVNILSGTYHLCRIGLVNFGPPVLQQCLNFSVTPTTLLQLWLMSVILGTMQIYLSSRPLLRMAYWEDEGSNCSASSSTEGGPQHCQQVYEISASR